MPCKPSDNSLNPPIKPNIAIPGFTLPSAPIQLPYPDFTFPAGLPEDLEALVNSLGLLFPSSLYKPNLDLSSRTIFDAVASLLNQIAPFLSLYKFFIAALNIIICIIEVLCALMNPFKLRRAIRKLFKNCLPNFLALFPFVALIVMIIALLLLLLALIEYLIATINAYIQEIIRNINLLADAVTVNDSERSLSAARKIASLLCLIENLFAILVAFGAVLAIVQELAQIGGRSVCDDSSGGCCDNSVCPPFMRNSPDGLTGSTGELIYFRELDHSISGSTLALFPTSFSFGAARQEQWQFVNPATGQLYKISDIITPIEDNIFWPDSLTFDNNSNLKKVPYFLDMRLFLNPVHFINTASDTKGSRYFKINNCIISDRPYIGVNKFNNTVLENPNTGTIHILGGQVFEDDGITPVLINGIQASLTNFIHQNSGFAPSSGPIIVDDGYYISNVSYNLRYNYEALLSYGLIVVGCLPDIAVERNIVNTQYADISSVINKIKFPNITGSTSTGATDGVIACLQNALIKFRKDVSLEAAAIFQADVATCLGTLQSDTKAAYSQAIGAGFNQFTSTIELTPSIQFVGSAIDVKITLRDPTGTPITFNMPAEFVANFISRISATPTLGIIAPFTYDGTQSFISTITSIKPGDGTLTAEFDKKIFSTIINRDQDGVPSQIVENIIPYSFVGSVINSDDQAIPRRDGSDVSLDDKV